LKMNPAFDQRVGQILFINFLLLRECVLDFLDGGSPFRRLGLPQNQAEPPLNVQIRPESSSSTAVSC
jgi:hypothetical protein